MKKNDSKIFLPIIVAVIALTISVIIVGIGMVIADNNKKIETLSENYVDELPVLTANNTVDTIIAPIEINEEEHIYGYDENAMQVASSYDGFPACGFLEIPKTNVAMPILSNQTVAGMEYSCCLLYSTGTINLSGNTYIVGHNYDNGTLFSNNKNLAVGDKIILTGLYKNRIEYTIYNMFNTTPDDVSYLTKNIDENNIELTIQTCNNDEADTRLIIEARHEIKK